MGNFDTTFKEMMRQCLSDLVRWMVPRAHHGQIEDLSQELPATLRRVDALVRIGTPGVDESLQILECQAQRDETLHRTMFLRAALAHFHYNLPVSTTLLCLRPEAVVEPNYRYGSSSNGWLEHEIFVVKLYELSADFLLEHGRPSLWPLVPVLRPSYGDRPRVLREALQRIMDLDWEPEKVRLLLNCCATFATLHLNESYVQAIVEDVARSRQTMFNVIEQTPVGQRLVDKGIDQGIAQSILEFLAARGLAVSEDLRERVLSCADHAQLKRWVARAATAATAEEALAEG